MALHVKPGSLLDRIMPDELEELAWIPYSEVKEERQEAYANAVRLINQIIGRVPAPRAYIADLTHLPDEKTDSWWETGKDMLIVQLVKQNIGVIDPASLRAIMLLCPILHDSREDRNPFWLHFVRYKIIHRLYLPNDGHRNPHHRLMRARAQKEALPVHWWWVDTEPL